MQISLTPLPLTKRYPLTTSRGTEATSDNLLVTVESEGIVGYGEFSPVDQASPSEDAASATRQLTALATALESVRPWETQTVDRLASEAAVGAAALCALDIALLDWRGKRLGVPAYRLFGCDLDRIVPTSLTIGINPPDIIRARVAELVARLSPHALKIKLGSPAGCDHDRAIFAAVRETAPTGVALRVDANGGWPTVEIARDMMRWLAERGAEYVEQPLAQGREAELPALFHNRPLPIFADESCRVASDIPGLADRVDGVNLKLMKAGGPRAGMRLIHVARAHGLQVMMGCMSESPLAIAGSVALSAYADHLDLDSHLNLLDPLFDGLLWRDGRVLPPASNGLGVHSRRRGTLMPRLTADNRLVLLMHDAVGHSSGKMGYGLLRYGASPVVAIVDRAAAGQSLRELTGIPLDIPIVATVAEALPYGPNVLVPAIAPGGGVLPPAWRTDLLAALDAGLSLVNGLHVSLGKDPELTTRVTRPGQFIWDIRQEPPGLPVGAGRAREATARRVLFVGTDMDIGKMTAALETTKELQSRGHRAKFLATGQIGIAISGDGIPLDAVRIDFASGAVEQLVLAHAPNNDFLLIEGQGSLLNPASTATLPLMRGAMPTDMILVHRVGQTYIDRIPWVPIPPLAEVVKFYEAVAAAAGALPATKVVGIALNTRDLDEVEAEAAIRRTRDETGLPVTDVVRYGAAILADAIIY